ncbi:MAG: AAA domain-containing protein [Chitinivibrionales bacterium]|nr:AAA domain-containing protein [Chitinivibrionales bacterium]
MHNIPIFPFCAIVGQDEMKLALILNVIDQSISGVLVRGEKGTAKSTAVRALADILPHIEVVKDCPFNLTAEGEHECCAHCPRESCREAAPADRVIEKRKVGVVDLPVGATEDRLVGTLDIEHALKSGEKRFEPGILAAAHRGFLYVDEVNLLDDHLVDLLLDSAAMGKNSVEREGVSFSHPARFVLVGTMNPEEGELRPQLLDRFGLCVQVTGIDDPEKRVQVMERRAAFDEDPRGFVDQWREQAEHIARKVDDAVKRRRDLTVNKDFMLDIARLCIRMQVDGHRADIITLKASKALAAWRGRKELSKEDIDCAAEMALPHRLRRQPFDEIGGTVTQ